MTNLEPVENVEEQQEILVNFLTGCVGFARQNKPEATEQCIADAKNWFKQITTQDRLNTHKAVVEIAPCAVNTKTGEKIYDAGVMEYMARIDELFGVSKK